MLGRSLPARQLLPRSCQMKRVLLALLILLSLGLCGICLVQWQREFRLRATISDLRTALVAENKLRIEAEAKVGNTARRLSD